MSTRIAVIGTGTGVGKTHVSVALLTVLVRQGRRTSGLKPVETGVGSEETDASRLAQASSLPPLPPPYAFLDPVSPHLAARRTHQSISLNTISAWVDQHEADWLVIETAGGLLSPLGPGLTNLDLVRSVAPQILYLVTSDRLGVLHDVSACMVALRALLPTPTPLVCLQAPPIPDTSSGTNADEIRSLGIAPQVISFPRSAATASDTLAAATEALAILSASRP